MSDVPQTLYDVVEAKCRQTIIRDLLRQYRRSSRNLVQIGSRTSEMISNLRAAVDSGIIPMEVVQQMVRECEENGNQHIFLFRAKSNRSLYNDGNHIAESLHGSSSSRTTGICGNTSDSEDRVRR